MPDSSQSIWKPLFWLVLATLIAVYSLYNYHSDQLQAQIGDGHQTLRSLSHNLDAVKDELAKTTQALEDAETEISALQSRHTEQLDRLKAEHQGAASAMQQAHEQRLAELSERLDEFSSEKTLLTAETEAWKRAKDKLEQDLRSAIEASAALEARLADTDEAGPSPEAEALQARIEQLEASLQSMTAERDQLATAHADGQSDQDVDEAAMAELSARIEAERAAFEEQLSDANQRIAALQAELKAEREALEQAVADAKAQHEDRRAAALAEAEATMETLQQRLVQDKEAAIARLEQRHSEELSQALAEAEARISELSEALEAEREAMTQQTAAYQQEQTELSAKLNEAETSLEELKQRLAAREDAHQSKSANDQARISEAEAALDAMRRELQQQEDALQSAREQRTRLRENVTEQVSEQVHDFYQRFAPLEAQLTDRGLLVNLSDENIRFPSGSAVLPEDAAPTLSQLAKILLDHPGLRVQIEGHTDSPGGAALNLELSEQRAAAVREALVERGVQPERLTIEDLGSTQPIADNATEAGRQRNRRVALYVMRKDDSESARQ
ncbi:OmpA family protein [Halochromatium sp.]